MTDNRLKILVVMHKDYPYVVNPTLLPIQVNKKHAICSLPFQGDDEGENISSKNDNFCELTAMYWAWKNMQNTDFIGLFHYRRYLVIPSFSTKFLIQTIMQHLRCIKANLKVRLSYKYTVTRCDFFHPYSNLSELSKDFNKILKKIKLSEEVVYLPPKTILPNLSVRDQYIYYHISEDWIIMESVLKEMYPEYMVSYDKIVHHNTLYPYNIFIMGKQTFNDYCSWVFSILFEVEKRIFLSSYSLQKRVFGFMAERLFNVYIEYNKQTNRLKTKTLALAIYEPKDEKSI